MRKLYDNMATRASIDRHWECYVIGMVLYYKEYIHIKLPMCFAKWIQSVFLFIVLLLLISIAGICFSTKLILTIYYRYALTKCI